MAKTAKQNRGKTLRRVKKGIAKASKRFVKNVKQLSMRGRQIFGRAKKMKIWGGDHNGKKVVLLIIDPQNDFTNIPDTMNKLGSNEGLPVIGATNDFNNIIAMLKGDMGGLIDEIHISLDSHNDTHIGHVGFWKRLDGNPVEPGVAFKVIENVEDGTQKIVNKRKHEDTGEIEEYQAEKEVLQKWAIKYIEKMHRDKKPDPLIWNKHCIKGSNGWMVYEPLWEEIIKWRKGNPTRTLYIHEKGGNDLCEMYSIMQAEVTYEELLNDFDEEDQVKIISTQGGLANPTVPEFIQVTDDKLRVNPSPNLATSFNQPLYDALCGTHDKQNILLICGEAKSHCVKSSATDIVEKMETTGYNPNHVYILEDAMSSVKLLDVETNKLYETFSKDFIENMRVKLANITTTKTVLQDISSKL